jgi:hypothetical protein
MGSTPGFPLPESAALFPTIGSFLLALPEPTVDEDGWNGQEGSFLFPEAHFLIEPAPVPFLFYRIFPLIS